MNNDWEKEFIEKGAALEHDRNEHKNIYTYQRGLIKTKKYETK